MGLKCAFDFDRHNSERMLNTFEKNYGSIIFRKSSNFGDFTDTLLLDSRIRIISKNKQLLLLKRYINYERFTYLLS